MDRQPNVMQPPANPSDPRATTVHVTGDMTALPGIPGYKVLKKLGQGGMATVYMATQVSLDRTVSIKVMERDTLSDEVSMQRFENETRTIAKLSHPNIVAIYEVGRTDDGRMYYSMPFLPNGDLAQRDLGKDESRIVELLRTLLSALDYAHARGIVHRDVKQENVLFDADNRPLLADFGIALSKSDDVRITTAGLAVGSSGYMAPEQARGDAVDARADLYSVGVLAYELLTGELPFRSGDALAIALMHAQKDVPRLPPAKRHWQAFIDRAMAKSPDQRFANAKEMLEALDRIGRRSGNHISQRVLRTLDRTAPGNGWKRPRMILIAGALLLAGGLYAARDRLPSFGGQAASRQPVASAASPAIAPIAPASGTASTANTTPSTAAPPPTPAVATPPTPTMSPEASTATAAELALGKARAELEHANLTSPEGNNAVDLTLAAWELDKATPDTRRLVNDVLKALSTQEALAIEQHSDQRASDYEQKAALLDKATVGQSVPAWQAFRAATANALLSRARKESAASDSAGVARTQALAQQLEVPGALALLQGGQPGPNPSQPPANPAPPAATDVGALANIDPGFVKLHGQIGIFPPAAIAAAEVTRRDYAAFVAATHRSAADCSNPKPERTAETPQRFGQGAGRFGRGRYGQGARFGQGYQAPRQPADTGRGDKTWTDPGFAQNSDHPVVCVSWDDASAYALWLSQRNGHRYRLPSSNEWRMAIAAGVGNGGSGQGTVAAASGSPNTLGLYGLDGNVSEWLQDCAFGCERHQVAGRSWRDRGTDQVPSGRLNSRGFDDVGFRVVEILGTRK